MEKINGYKKEEIIRLVNFIKKGKKQGKSLSVIFYEYGKEYGRAKGSVRNFYYQLLREEQKNDLAKQILFSSNLKAQKIIEFDNIEAENLIKKILLGKAQGRSVRNVITEISNGESKLMLRFQNKYRNAIKNQPELIKKLVLEVKEENGQDLDEIIFTKNNINDFAIKRLQREINGLYNRLNENLQTENKTLKEKLLLLEEENYKLKTIEEDKNKAEKYFTLTTPKKLLN